VLAKHCPLDFHVRAFPERTCAQSVFGHVNALLYRREGVSAFTLIVARSFGHDVWQMLCHSSMQYGYDIVPPREF
jgi:heterotetrameric sarcosine oxidase gamma subunit